MVPASSFKNFLVQIFNPDKYGSSIVIRDDNCVILTDCGDILHEQIDAVIQKYPRTQVEYVSTSSSKSGFVVIFTNWSNYSIWQSTYFFQSIFALILLACASSYTSYVIFWAYACNNFRSSLNKFVLSESFC